MIESLVSTAFEVILSERYLLYGVILLGVALALEIINGLIEIALYTFMIGAAVLLGLGVFSVVF